ncbi:MAG: cysteine synthase family protein [Acidobacteriota bacterium]
MRTPSSSETAVRTAANAPDLIGSTPMVELSRFARGAARVFAKLEWYNPGGSVKDRIARAMIDDAQARGLLQPGGTIVEATSGNTGVAVAVVAAARGYRCVIVMPEGYGAVKAKLIAAAGAEIVWTKADAKIAGAIARAEEIVRATAGAFQPSQFHNPANPRAHYETTGPEIAEQIGGRIDAWVAGVGTTGTFTGVARYLSQRHPGILRVAVEPQGSILGGGEPGPHDVEGIGLSQLWPILDRSLIDEVMAIGDAESFATCRTLAREEGLFVGGSSGTAAAAALRIARRLGPEKIVVTLFPDGAERYPDKGILNESSTQQAGDTSHGV